MDKIKSIIEETWINSNNLIAKNAKYIDETINLLEVGKIRVANKQNDQWIINQWIKKGILLYFKKEKTKEMKIDFNKSTTLEYRDKIKLKHQLMQLILL